MNDPVYQRLREISWRRKLTDTEQAELRAWLAAHPETRAEAELEFALSGALAKLPDAPVSSNFTARVLQDIEREAMQPGRRPRHWAWVWRVLVPRAAVALLVVGVGVFGYERYRAAARLAAIKKSLMAVSEVRSLPSPEALEHFDEIRRMSSSPAADKELLALMQ